MATSPHGAVVGGAPSGACCSAQCSWCQCSAQPGGVGIDKEQLETIRSQVTEGTSALFVVTDEGDLDRVGERFHGTNMKLVHTNLTKEERDLMLETFGEE
jgi:uncharacterized membrane protein